MTASSAQHTSAAGLVVHTSQKVFMFARLEGVCRLSLVDCRRQNVTPFRDEGTKRCKRVYRILTTGGSEVPDASVVLFSVFSLVGSHPRAILFHAEVVATLHNAEPAIFSPVCSPAVPSNPVVFPRLFVMTISSDGN